jgi:hypothetical protein
MDRRLSVEADLDLTVDGHPVAVRGAGQRLVVEVDSARTAWRLFQSRRPGRRLARTVTDTLEQFGLDVQVVVGGRHLASVGASAVPDRLTRALGVEGVALTPAVARTATWTLVGLAFLAGAALGARR